MNADDVIGAVWSPDDGRVSPSDLCAALVKGARARGTRIYEDTGVTGILTRSGRVTGVGTNRGKVRCDAVALCTGLWSRKAAAMADVEVPVWPCEHFYLLTEPIDGIEGNVPSLSDHDGHLYIRDDSGRCQPIHRSVVLSLWPRPAERLRRSSAVAPEFGCETPRRGAESAPELGRHAPEPSWSR